MREQALEYTLVKNHLDNNEGFMAKVIHQKGLSFEELLKEMEKNTAIRSQDLRLAMAQLEKVILENTARGLKVATPFGTFKATVRGSFASLHEEFRPNHPGINHRVKLHFTPARRFTKKLTEEIAVRKLLEHRLPHPHVAKVINRSAPSPRPARPGDVLELYGINLKADPDAADEGVFLENGTGDVFPAELILQSTKSRLTFQVPPLARGEYTLKVAVRLRNPALRIGEAEEKLLVGP